MVIALGLALALLGASPTAEATSVSVSAGQRDAAGVVTHEIDSPYQAGTTQLRVVLPDNLQAERRYPVVYVLPVEANREQRFGDGIAEILRHDLARRHQAIFVAPTFSHLPWYCDHPTDPRIRQESYLLQVVVPFVERTYPARAGPDGRLLLGFSKSGWGAWTLLLRHPDVFGRAAAWDAPLMMDRLGKYGTTPIFGTESHFQRYRPVPPLALEPASLAGRPRLLLTGYGNFRQDHKQMHEQLRRQDLAHEYRDGPARKHDWHSGWVPEAVELLLPAQDRP